MRALQGMMVCLLIFCAVNLRDSVVVIQHEYLYPYSGAEDAARFLRSHHAAQTPIFGFLYGIVGIQANFDRNIFANLETTYFHHGLPLAGATLNLDEVRRMKPRYIVAFTEQPQLMIDSGALKELEALGYRMVHFSDGYLLYKAGVYVRQAYLILERAEGNQSGAPLNSNAPASAH
jgi:hypothetical protein